MKLNDEQIAQFATDGYLLLRGALADADLDPIIAEYQEYIGRRAEGLLAEGKISDLYADEPFDRRLVSICREDREIYKELDIMYFRGRASFEFLVNDNLLDMVEALVGPEITRPILDQAEEILLTEAEFIKANLPAYEEPENTFTVSCLEPDRLDSWSWHPSSEGCRWEKTGGYKEGTGCLIIENRISGFGSWEEFFTGPSHWGNPFVKGARYRLSAWVKVDLCDCHALESGPQVGVMFSNTTAWPNQNPSETLHCGWSEQLTGPGTPRLDHIPWTRIELVTEPCPSHGGMAALRLHFSGRGTAYFSCVRWEMVEE